MATQFLNNIRIKDEYTLPSTDGSANQIIRTDGSGNLSFVDLSAIADSRYVNVTGDTMTGGLEINYASGTNPLLELYNTTNGSGSIIKFSDQTDQTQVGTITYYHSDSASQSGGASFWFESEPDTVLIVGNSTNKGRFASYSQNSTSEVDYGFGGNVNTGMYSPGANQVGLVAGGSRKLLVNSSGASIQNGGLTVDNGAITLNGTGRIQGIDTVSADTDAANKLYVDNAVSPLMTSFNLEADTGNQAISNGEKIVVTGGFGIATTLTVPAANTNEVTIDLARGLTTVTKALDTFAINLSSGENFLLNASGTYYITLTIASSNVGQSGTIVINNTAATSAQALPSYMLTPEGATLDWVNTSGAVSIISYFVLATDKVLCNYVGNFQ